MPPKPIHVFIDTNVFLSFFAYTGDDIDQLRKLQTEIKAEKLFLYLPQQVVDEFDRNREKKIKETLDGFTKNEQKALPRFMFDYAEADDYADALKNIQKIKNSLINTAKADAENKKLATDTLFDELSSAATIIPVTEQLYLKAVRRHRIGKPPGKQDSIGDRINWECLLENAKEGTDLHIVSKDGDYYSPLNDGKAHQFLIDEWKKEKNGTLHLHREIKPFLKAKLEIEIEGVDEEKNEAIDSLILSPSFSCTHSAVSNLEQYIDFLNIDDALNLIEALKENNQVRWIHDDDDVREFYKRLIKNHESAMDTELRKYLQDHFGF